VRVLTNNKFKLHSQSHIGTVVGCSQADTVSCTSLPFHVRVQPCVEIHYRLESVGSSRKETDTVS
jgi:hypothetical protein